MSMGEEFLLDSSITELLQVVIQLVNFIDTLTNLAHLNTVARSGYIETNTCAMCPVYATHGLICVVKSQWPPSC